MAATSAASSAASKGFMNSPVGPKTIFFWAPLFKWCLVAAGVNDLTRPAENLSIPQNLGLIWVRYSFVITPVNYSLAAVNAFVGGTGAYQLFRVVRWRSQNPQLAAAKGVPSQEKEVPQPITKLG
ncbi:MAG: hypothetical protein CYPHOPRED_003526 [Cyphobasidiales sp. Tagirdzhanova-0007]|nr:MAG: hypothetical protein CYPHOPRED_003526 [Cyphobasidiales sp. Tagirdzhanova-0007]